MSHKRTDSGISELFHDTVVGKMDGPRYTSILVTEAQDHLNALRQNNDRFIQTPDTIHPSIDSYLILQAMLDYSDRSGGPNGSDHSQRYIASAIICCEEEVEQLVALANTFVGVFLWPFASNAHCDSSPSAQATPTSETTASFVGASIENSSPTKIAFQKEVLKQDAYKCVVLQARDHRCRPEGEPLHSSGLSYKVEACHILKRAAALTARQTDKKTTATFEILHHYCGLTTHEIFEMDSHLDDPSNGISLSVAVHNFFDEFRWCLIPEPQANTYRIVEFGGPWIPPSRPSPVVTFLDHSTTSINIPSTARDLITSNTGFALPNPTFVRIHASIAHVLHMSAAAEVLGLIMERYKPFGPAVPAGKPTASLDTAFAALSLVHG